MQRFEFQHRHKAFQVVITDHGTLELRVDGCLRKDRPATGREPQYVWTNLELQWEEHHYIEARFWASSGRLSVTVNGEPLFDGPVAAAGDAAFTVSGTQGAHGASASRTID